MRALTYRRHIRTELARLIWQDCLQTVSYSNALRTYFLGFVDSLLLKACAMNCALQYINSGSRTLLMMMIMISILCLSSFLLFQHSVP